LVTAGRQAGVQAGVQGQFDRNRGLDKEALLSSRCPDRDMATKSLTGALLPIPHILLKASIAVQSLAACLPVRSAAHLVLNYELDVFCCPAHSPC
jgi:hypothetical protein